MSFEFNEPVSPQIVSQIEEPVGKRIGGWLNIYKEKGELPDLSNIQVAIIGVKEGRGAIGNFQSGSDFSSIRKEFYNLFPGNWNIKVADLGDIPKGNEIQDTYFLLEEMISYLIENKIIPVVLGGGHDLTLASVETYKKKKKPINLVIVDNKFNLITTENKEINSQSFLSKIFAEDDSSLLNCINIGYQTYLNAQEEIILMDNLYFDTYRLGEVVYQLNEMEPVFRNADTVSIDLSSIKSSDAPANLNAMVNGFSGTDGCAISRYAGLSDTLTSLGIYEYNPIQDKNNRTAQLIAQMIWYFIEGVNNRSHEEVQKLDENKFKKYIVWVDNYQFYFYKSKKSDRWWVDIDFKSNKLNVKTLVPCNYEDYVMIVNKEIPNKWVKTIKRLM